MKLHPFIKELQEKELIDNITNLEKVSEILTNGRGIYIGFDPTAISIHLGNFVVVNVLMMAIKHKIPVVALIGGATGGIGDPSGKKNERILIDKEQLKFNTEAIEKQISKFLPNAKIINNSIFYENESFISFLRNVGKYIQVSYMVSKEIVKSRLDEGISFTEFAYSLIQANDFYHLHHDYNIGIQMGGSDQWGNITAGIELIRKKDGDTDLIGGITIKLFLKSDGTKFGKSEKGAIYLDSKLTSPYTMYQFLINQADNDIKKLLNYLSNFSFAETEEIVNKHFENPKQKYGQKALANNLVEQIHGKELLEEVKKISEILFDTDNLNSLTKHNVEMIKNSFEFKTVQFKIDQKIVDILVEAKLFNSKTEILNLISQKGLKIGEYKIENPHELLEDKHLIHDSIFVKKGKQNYFLIVK